MLVYILILTLHFNGATTIANINHEYFSYKVCQLSAEVYIKEYNTRGINAKAQCIPKIN